MKNKIKIEYDNWFYKKCENGSRMMAITIPFSLNILISKELWHFGISFLWWDLFITNRE